MEYKASLVRIRIHFYSSGFCLFVFHMKHNTHKNLRYIGAAYKIIKTAIVMGGGGPCSMSDGGPAEPMGWVGEGVASLPASKTVPIENRQQLEMRQLPAARNHQQPCRILVLDLLRPTVGSPRSLSSLPP